MRFDRLCHMRSCRVIWEYTSFRERSTPSSVSENAKTALIQLIALEVRLTRVPKPLLMVCI